MFVVPCGDWRAFYTTISEQFEFDAGSEMVGVCGAHPARDMGTALEIFTLRSLADPARPAGRNPTLDQPPNQVQMQVFTGLTIGTNRRSLTVSK
jgi:hypothetical protein